MPVARLAVVSLLSLRLAYGLALVAAPARLTKRWLGPVAQGAGTQVAIRGMGAREVLLHAGALRSALQGDPVRPWLAASIAGDLTDIAATVAGRSGLPPRSPAATLAVAGGSAALSLAVGAAQR